MKKVISTILVVAIVMFVNVAHSQEAGATKSKVKTYRQAITTDPINLLNTDRFNIKYERGVGKKNSFTIDLMYDYGYIDIDAFGIAIGGGYRWYFHTLFPELRTRGLEGLAVGGFANISYLQLTEGKDKGSSYTVSNVAFNFGVEAIYKFVILDALAIEPTLRLGWALSNAGYYSKGFNLWPGISIGYAW
jgi:hypothetical protein